MGFQIALQFRASNEYAKILEQFLQRTYLLRCQLVHGAATHNSQPNRRAVRNCAAVLGALVTAFLLVIMDHGVDEDWGNMCYPPDPTAG